MFAEVRCCGQCSSQFVSGRFGLSCVPTRNDQVQSSIGTIESEHSQTAWVNFLPHGVGAEVAEERMVDSGRYPSCVVWPLAGIEG